MEQGLSKKEQSHIHLSNSTKTMKPMPEILIEINMVRAVERDAIPFLTTRNNVVLTDATIPAECIRSVIEDRKYLHQAPLDYICVFDFEATCCDDDSLKYNEIIEFPVVIIDVKNKKIKAEFDTFVKPEIDPILHPFTT